MYADTILKEGEIMIQDLKDPRIRLLLTRQEYNYLTAYLSGDKTMTQIAADAGVTRSAVSRRIKSAKERITKYLEGGE